MKFHCFFEQSGTFKNEFKKLGYTSFDYDLLNDFNQTDYVCDLFTEIERAYVGMPSIFDKISKDDLIFAFFPCVRFTHRMFFNFLRLKANKLYEYNDIEKLEENIKFFNEINFYYSIISKLVIVCLRFDLKLVIENPYNDRHILTQFWHIKPKIIHYDRTLYGDNFKKPTQYWFINFEPKQNVLFEPLMFKQTLKVKTCNKVARSLISSEYANFFIRSYIL